MTSREEEIKEALSNAFDTELWDCETDSSYCSYRAGFSAGVKWADKNPTSPWISAKDDLPYNHKDLVRSNYTDSVLVMSRHGYTDVAFMSKMEEDAWEWSCLFVVLYWMPIPKLSQD